MYCLLLWGAFLSPPAGTAFEPPVARHIVNPSPSLPLYTMAVSAIPHRALLPHTVCRIRPRRLTFRELSTIVAPPIMAFHAFVNDAAEAGQTPDITEPWLVSGYGIAVPLWRLTLVSVSSVPRSWLTSCALHSIKS